MSWGGGGSHQPRRGGRIGHKLSALRRRAEWALPAADALEKLFEELSGVCCKRAHEPRPRVRLVDVRLQADDRRPREVREEEARLEMVDEGVHDIRLLTHITDTDDQGL